MNTIDTISIQELRKDPIGFLKQLNKGKTMTVIYHSKPYAVVTSADNQLASPQKSTKALLHYAALARNSAKVTLDPNKSFKQLYYEDMAKKYGLS